MPNGRSATLFRNVLIRGAAFATADRKRGGDARDQGPTGPHVPRFYPEASIQLVALADLRNDRNMDVPSKALNDESTT